MTFDPDDLTFFTYPKVKKNTPIKFCYGENWLAINKYLTLKPDDLDLLVKKTPKIILHVILQPQPEFHENWPKILQLV